MDYLFENCEDMLVEIMKHLDPSSLLMMFHVSKKFRTITEQFPITKDPSLEACRNGSLNVLIYMTRAKYSLSNKLYYFAMASDHLHILRWLHSVNIDNKKLNSNTFLTIAGSRGNPEIVEWLCEINRNNTSILSFQLLMEGASQKGNLEIIKLIYKEGRLNVNNHDIYGCEELMAFYHAITRGYVHVLEWCKSIGQNLQIYEIKFAVDREQINSVRWMLNNGSSWGTMTLNYVINGLCISPEFVESCIELECPGYEYFI
jgi:hypothetical protein